MVLSGEDYSPGERPEKMAYSPVIIIVVKI